MSAKPLVIAATLAGALGLAAPAFAQQNGNQNGQSNVHHVLPAPNGSPQMQGGGRMPSSGQATTARQYRKMGLPPTTSRQPLPYARGGNGTSGQTASGNSSGGNSNH